MRWCLAKEWLLFRAFFGIGHIDWINHNTYIENFVMILQSGSRMTKPHGYGLSVLTSLLYSTLLRSQAFRGHHQWRPTAVSVTCYPTTPGFRNYEACSKGTGVYLESEALQLVVQVDAAKHHCRSNEKRQGHSRGSVGPPSEGR